MQDDFQDKACIDGLIIKQSPAKLAERACNQAILAAMESEDEALLAQRDKACAAVR